MLTHHSTPNNGKPYPAIVALVSRPNLNAASQRNANTLVLQILGIGVICSFIALMLLETMHPVAGQSPHVIIALLLTTIPESLLIALPILVIFCIYRLRSQNVFVNNTRAIEAIGDIDTVIITDKDTLLEKPGVETFWHFEQKQHTMNLSLAKAINRAGEKLADDMDRVMADYVERNDVTFPSQKPLNQFFFDAGLEVSGTLWHHGDSYELYLKGSPDYLLNRCDLSENERESVETTIHSFASQNKHVLVVTHIALSHPITHIKELKTTQRMQFDGLMVITQTIRPEARAAVSLARSNGIRIKIVTGNHLESARALSCELGIVPNHASVIDSRHVQHASTEQKKRMSHTVSVMAGVTFERVPAALTILSGRSTSIPIEGNFESTVRAIVLSRQLFGNIRHILIYLLTIGSIGTLILSEALIGGIAIPFLSIQTLWANFVVNTLIILTIGLKANNPYQPSTSSTKSLISMRLLQRMIIIIITTASLALGMYAVFDTYYGRTYAQTITLTILSSLQWIIAYYILTIDNTAMQKRSIRPLYIFGFVATFLFQLLVFPSPLCTTILHTAPISLWTSIVTLIGSISIFIFLMEVHKRVDNT